MDVWSNIDKAWEKICASHSKNRNCYLVAGGVKEKIRKLLIKKRGIYMADEAGILIILWTIGVIVTSSGYIKLAKNMINGYGSPNVHYTKKYVELSPRMRKIFRIKKKRAPKLARDFLYQALYLYGIYLCAHILTGIFYTKITVVMDVLLLLFWLQFVPMIVREIFRLLGSGRKLVRFIKVKYEKRRDKKK